MHIRGLRQADERNTGYSMPMPVIRRAIVAAVFFAAACQEPKAVPLARASVLPDSAQQMMFGVRFYLTDAGVRNGEVRADTAYIYDDANTRTELRPVTATFFTTAGEKSATLTARRGTYQVRVGSMEARGNVVVVSTDGQKLETPHLRYDPTRNEISSDSAFTLTRPDNVVKGIGFISDPQMRNIRILRAAQSTGKAVTIPKR
jgi:LPS export ABC transporter protein LptC